MKTHAPWNLFQPHPRRNPFRGRQKASSSVAVNNSRKPKIPSEKIYPERKTKKLLAILATGCILILTAIVLFIIKRSL